jgi:hypothetical protein
VLAVGTLLQLGGKAFLGLLQLLHDAAVVAGFRAGFMNGVFPAD